MRERSQNWLSFAVYSTILIFYIFVGAVAAHPFDDYIYARHAQYFYYMLVSPAYGLPMGLYYDLINIGGYFVTILLGTADMVNVLTVQIGVKIPFIIFTFLTAYFVYKILKDMGYNGNYASLILLTSPMYFFTSVIYGSPLVVSIFFLISSVFFLFRKRTLFSAALFGLSVGSYLYPLFSLPFVARFIYKEEGRKQTAIYLIVTFLFAAIGQLIVLYLYAKTGTYSISPNVPSGYFSATSLPYYSVFDLFAILRISSSIPGTVYSYFYYFVAIAASLSYFFIRKERVNKYSLLAFLLIQGVIFSALNPGNLPSYMAAMIPFAILIATISKKWVLLGMIWVSSVLDFLVIQTINPAGLLIYFSDVNLKILGIKNPLSSGLVYLFGFLYSLSLLLFIPISLSFKAGSVTRFKKTVISQLSVVGVFCLISLLVLVPVVSNIPSNMYLSDELNTFAAQPVAESLSGHSLSVEYLIPTVGFLGKGYLGYFIGSIQIPSQFETMYNYSKNYASTFGNYSEHLLIPYPIDNVTLELFAKKNGTIYLELVNDTSTLVLHSSVYFSNNYTISQYSYSSILSGSYLLKVESTVPLYAYNESSLSIFLGGSPQAGVPVVDNVIMQGSYIPGYLLKSKLLIDFTGPFQKIPPFVPFVEIYLAKNLGKPVLSAFTGGGIMFGVLIAVPIWILFFPKKTGRSRLRRE